MKTFYTSILIVLLSFLVAQSQSLQIDPLQVPVIKGENKNPIFRIKCISGESSSFQSITLNLKGTKKLSDIKSLSIYSSGNDSSFALINSNAIALQNEIAERLHFDVRFDLDDSINYLWISCQLNENATLVNTISCTVEEIILDQKKVHIGSFPGTSIFRYGLALRKHNQDGIHTTRIPGLATSDNGTLIAVYDARRNSSRDLQGDIDIGLNRSLDGGESWQPIQIVLDMDNWGNLPEKYNGVSDACILVNGKDIYVTGLWMHGVINSDGHWVEGLTKDSTAWNHQWRNKGSQPGFDPKQTSQFLITKSSDDGQTWSNPINLTPTCKKEAWWLWAPAPGRGIVMENGTLVFPTQGRDENGLPFSNITYSTDNGSTWHTSNPANQNTTECSVVENTPGQLMLNIRDNRNRHDKSETNGRAIYTTNDLGTTWTEHSSSHNSLIESVCMASLHKHQYSDHDTSKEVLLFANPNSKYQRVNQTIKMSFDGGITWPKDHWILLDEGRGRGYSCITSIDENTIGIVYESSRADLVFQKIELRDFLLKH